VTVGDWLVCLWDEGMGNIDLTGAELRLGPLPSHPAVAEGWRFITAVTPATTHTGWEWATQAVRNAWPDPLSWTESPHQWETPLSSIVVLHCLAAQQSIYLQPMLPLDNIPFTPGIRSHLLALGPSRLQGMLLAVLSGLVGNPISAAAAVLAQAEDVGEGSGPPSTKKVHAAQQAASERPKPSRRDMFLALLAAGVSKEEIDGNPTSKTVKRHWALCHPGTPRKGMTAAPPPHAALPPHTRDPPAVSPTAPQVPAPPGQWLPSQPQQ
uniref:Uncharacterized protein n=1 Tax=Pelusios castaneus TaxID=367368 RepID=A0A8C8S683_9SAUR